MSDAEIEAHPEEAEDHQLDHRQVILDRETFLREATTLRSVLASMGIDSVEEACQYLTAVAHRRRNPGSIEWAVDNGHVINRWSPMPLVSAMSRDGNGFGLSVQKAFEVADRTLHALHPDRTSLCRLRAIVDEDPILRQTVLADLAGRKSKLHPLLSRIRKEGLRDHRRSRRQGLRGRPSQDASRAGPNHPAAWAMGSSGSGIPDRPGLNCRVPNW